MTTTEHNVILPTFHLGGSSPRQLAEAYTNALNSIDEAMTHLSWTGPHGRDYYTNADGPTYVDADRKSTRLNSSHVSESRMPSSA